MTFTNQAAQNLKDSGIETLKWPNLNHINVDSSPSDINYRKHVYNYGGNSSAYSSHMAKCFQAEKEGRITRNERIRIFTQWKSYATAVITSQHKEKIQLNAARASARLLGQDSKYKLVLKD